MCSDVGSEILVTSDVRTCCGAERTCGFHGTTTCCRSRLVGESMPTVEFVMEESPVEEHQSNGTTEVTAREMQKQVRVMKSAFGRENEM